ncbi:MAG: hypothetical protein NW241_14785 [Bacteroidia bacterium]|nr:hypothetical protein [Bacteroidia bacterium]
MLRSRLEGLLAWVRRRQALLLYLILLPLLVTAAMRFGGTRLNRIWSDARMYYVYLPATFIYQYQNLPKLEAGPYDTYPGAKGVFTRSTYGVALLQAPFFLGAHLIAHEGWFRTRDAPNGFTMIYSDALVYSAAAYGLLGIFILYGVLRKRFAPRSALLTVLAIGLGTNLYYYTLVESGMAHVYGFFLAALLLRQTDRLYEQPDRLRFALLGLVLGLLIVIRPTNVLMALYPALYEVYTWEDVRKRFRFLLQHLPGALLGIGCVLLPWVPQLVYWKLITGHWIVYSYSSGATFIHWKHPKLLRVLFDVQNGLLIYSPVLWYSIGGLGAAAWSRRISAPAVGAMLVLALLAFGSWLAWWFGGAFGYRSIVDFLPFLALGMACMLDLLARTLQPWRTVWYLLLVFLAYYSLRLTYLYSAPWDGAAWTWDAFDEVLKRLFPW